MNHAGDCRSAWTLCREGGKAPVSAGLLSHAAHHAVMIAVSATAGGKVRIGVGGQHGRNQRPAEEYYQRKCDRAAHFRMGEYHASPDAALQKNKLVPVSRLSE
jgi:hypothetical protein